MTASLNEIYHLLGELGSSMKSINSKVDELKTDMKESEVTSADYRQGVREELGKIVLRTTYLETDMGTVKANVSAMQAVTDDVQELRQQAQGAGTLGKILIKVGIGVITAAGWLAAAYTYMTGRPPP